MTIGVVDIGIGNLGSVKRAVYNLGFDTISVSHPKDLSEVTHLLLPGVGAFQAAMMRLNKNQLIEPIKNFVDSGKPLLGICLGMQLLATRGTEGGETLGLNLIPGYVEQIDSTGHLRVPHVGWNEAHQRMGHPILNGIRNDVDFYFVHSFKFVTVEKKYILAETDYGGFFPSIVGDRNVLGIQFHPEKSQSNGIRLLENFCMWDGKC